MRIVFKVVLCVLLCVVLLATAGIAYLSATEYRPADTEKPSGGSNGAASTLSQGQSLTVLSWNIGYGALDKNADFFMDGGTGVRATDEAAVRANLNGIRATLYDGVDRADLFLFQEVDRDSARSWGLDEVAWLAMQEWAYAPNYECAYVPYPVPPLGRVHAGLLTDTSVYITDMSVRIALPCPFSWPLRLMNLKRCLLVTYLPIEGSDKKLALVNLHLEAYDDGEGREAQLRQLCTFLENEYQKGNYVIAGGDFNEAFPGTTERYPITTPELWQPSVLSEADLPKGFQLVWDADTPTCRLLNQPYDAETAQQYVIDGFILSPNVSLESVETLDLGFENADHNPVELRVTLG